MKKKLPKMVEQCRITSGPLASTRVHGRNGAFFIPYKRGRLLSVICSDKLGWDHVSVGMPDRCPTWPEMCFIKDLFFDDEELVLQFHIPKSQYINKHPFVLHMWRQHGVEPIQLPPAIMV